LASLERFTSAFGQSQGLLRAMDGEIAFWARGMERLYGYAAEDAVGRQSDDLLQTKFSTPFDTIKASLERDGHWAGDVVKRHKDGSILEIATQWTLHRGELGDADVIIVLDNNISERRRAEQANDRSSMLLRTIVETAPGPIYAKDREGRMLLANGGALQLIGRPWTEVQGRTDRDWLANHAHAEVVMANDRRIMTSGQVEAVEESVEDGHGVVREWLSTKTPIRRADGEVEGLVGVSVEITELKRRANEMGALNADLNAALADRTAALQQRDMLLREVYHRVKNNLQIIDGFIVLQARQMDDPLAKAALLGLRNRLHALALVHHQLMHSKNLKTFDIAPFLRELADNILQGGSDGVRLSVNAISLEVDLDFAIPLGLLLAELVTNSLKHAFKSGEGMIDVSLERTSDGFIALVVADDGQGRPPPHPSTGARKAGLGTRIIDGLVGQLQGELTMKNERGAWTEIRVPAPVLS
jgi:PAS domain S-box-containing protein